MNKLEEIKNNAVNISLSKTENFLNNLGVNKIFEIKSKYSTINTLECEVEKGKNCFKFKAGRILPKEPPVKYQNKSYGFDDTFYLEKNKNKIEIPSGSSDLLPKNWSIVK